MLRTEYSTGETVASRENGDTALTGEEPGSPNTDEQCMVWYFLSGDFIPTGHPNIDWRFQKGTHCF